MEGLSVSLMNILLSLLLILLNIPLFVGPWNWRARVKKRTKNGELEEAQSFPYEVWCFSSREQIT